MKIGIYTGRSLNPLHPRLDLFIQILNEIGYMYDIILPVRNNPLSRINWISLWVFDIYSILRTRNTIINYDVIFIHDLKYLPLAKYAKKMGKTVIYETLDNNVYLRFYDLQKKLPLIKPFIKIFITYFIQKEKKIALKYCDKIIVNSNALKRYFENKCELVLYSSLLERISTKNNSQNPTALVYLGAFSDDKGAEEIITLQSKLGIELFIYGSISSNEVNNKITKSNSIHHISRVNQAELTIHLKSLLERYFLTGISLIKSVNYSYATQEANKDIDYLALGIPIIGNHRTPTEEKIIGGCGVFIEDESKINQLLTDQQFKIKLSENCKAYYNSYYSLNEFNTRIRSIFTFPDAE